jgi:hypothetical protein
LGGEWKWWWGLSLVTPSTLDPPPTPLPPRVRGLDSVTIISSPTHQKRIEIQAWKLKDPKPEPDVSISWIPGRGSCSGGDGNGTPPASLLSFCQSHLHSPPLSFGTGDPSFSDHCRLHSMITSSSLSCRERALRGRLTIDQLSFSEGR